MQTDFLIIGQGIAGSILYHTLTKVGASCLVIDDHKPNSASRVAAGLINPVTGRRLVKSWMIDELIPAFQQVYGEIEKEYNIKCLYETELTWHLPAPDILQAFEKRLDIQPDFLVETDTAEQQKFFNFPFKSGNIRPCYIVGIKSILDSFRWQLENTGQQLNEKFDQHYLTLVKSGVRYKDIQADKIIFCEGSGATNNPWFAQLPYSLNKGEALLLSIKDLPADRIYKFKQTLVPLKENENLWWYGSNYIWDFKDEEPTKAFREASEKELRSWLKLPFTVIDHKAAIRYATVERRPFIGFHPNQPEIGIFNGWGTKGCSLVPFFAQQFANHLMNPELLIPPEVDVKRFNKLLASNSM